ncbi:MAG: glycan-binding surface protein [Paludibacter sp.]|nr:glycan-binding surface protein [Paludibacter sp.]
MRKYFLNIIITVLVAVSFTACTEDENSAIGGTPIVRYVRPCDATISDSLLTKSYLGSRITIIGEQLAGVTSIYFNDQKATLNPNFVTENAIIVDVPSGIPGLKEDLIKLYTSTDSCYYTFETLVPAPTVKSMSCEYVSDGDVAHIQGLYFVNDAASPLKVSFEGGLEAEIISQNITDLEVKVPVGAQPGPITVTSAYGEAESSLWFRDNRNIILTFNSDSYPDYGYFFGWHGGAGVDTANGINGNYLIFAGGEMTDDTWNDSKFGFEKWTYLPTDPDLVDVGKLSDYVLKFEANIPDVWSAAALQIVFTGAQDVMLNWQNGNGLTYSSDWSAANGYLSDKAWPRALWIPWASTGTFKTDGWITVSIPMTDFKFNGEGGSVSPKGAGHYSGITLLVNGGGIKGTACTPTFWIDNVRIVKK